MSMMSFGGWGFGRAGVSGGGGGPVWGVIDGEGVFGRDCEGKGICILTASVKKGDENYGKISIDHRHNRAGRLILG